MGRSALPGLFALVGLMALTCLSVLPMNAASQGMRLYGDVYMSNDTLASGYDDVWVGIYIDGNDNGEYEEWELYDTNNSQMQISSVTWNSTNGTYELQLDDGDPNWARGVTYYIIVNGTQWLDGNTTVHEHYSTGTEWTIPTEETVHENEVDVQTRFISFVINEFVYDDEGDDDDEWIEIYNPTSVARSIDYWVIHDNDTGSGGKPANRFKIGDIPDVPSGGYVVIHYANGTNDTAFGETQSGALHIYVNKENKWNNNEDQIILEDSYGLIVDFVAYVADGIYDSSEDDYAAVQAGIWRHGDFVDTSGAIEGDSVGLVYNGFDTNDPDDWIVYTGPSPGESNANGTPIPEFSLVVVAMAVGLLFVVARRLRPERL